MEMNKEFKIDHENPKKVYVWDDAREKYKRYPVFIIDGRMHAIDEGHEQNYLNCKYIQTCVWDNWEPIPAPKKRLLTDEELFERGATHFKNIIGRIFPLSYINSEMYVVNINEKGLLEKHKLDQYTEWTADRKTWHSFFTEGENGND
jgi:hypothetical protein